MNAKENLGTIHKVDGAKLSNSFTTAVIRSENIGCIKLSSGQIVLGNPLEKCSANDFKRKCFAHTVSPGVYPLMIYKAHTDTEQFLAFAEICFSSKRPVSFVTAKTIIDAETKRRGFNGYPVRNSETGFMDAEEFVQICDLPKMKDAHCILELDEEDAGENYEIFTNQESVPCAVSFTVPSGYYYWYWGKDSSGEVCCLIGDFFSFQ